MMMTIIFLKDMAPLLREKVLQKAEEKENQNKVFVRIAGGFAAVDGGTAVKGLYLILYFMT